MNDTNQLHGSMQAIYDRGQMAQSPKNFIPVVRVCKEISTTFLV